MPAKYTLLIGDNVPSTADNVPSIEEYKVLTLKIYAKQYDRTVFEKQMILDS